MRLDYKCHFNIRDYQELLDHIDKDKSLFKSFKNSIKDLIDNKEEVDIVTSVTEMKKLIDRYELHQCIDFTDEDFIDEVLDNADETYFVVFNEDDLYGENDNFDIYMIMGKDNE